MKLQFIGLDPACGVEIHDNEHQDEGAGGGTRSKTQRHLEWTLNGFSLGMFALTSNFSNFPLAFSQIKRKLC